MYWECWGFICTERAEITETADPADCADMAKKAEPVETKNEIAQIAETGETANISETSEAQNFWVKMKILNRESHDLALLSLATFWGKCAYFSIFEWQNSQLCQTKHNCEFYHSKIEK